MPHTDNTNEYNVLKSFILVHLKVLETVKVPANKEGNVFVELLIDMLIVVPCIKDISHFYLPYLYFHPAIGSS